MCIVLTGSSVSMVIYARLRGLLAIYNPMGYSDDHVLMTCSEVGVGGDIKRGERMHVL